MPSRIPGLDPGGIDRLGRQRAQVGRGATAGAFGAARGGVALGNAVSRAGEANLVLYEREMASRNAAALAQVGRRRPLTAGGVLAGSAGDRERAAAI